MTYFPAYPAMDLSENWAGKNPALQNGKTSGCRFSDFSNDTRYPVNVIADFSRAFGNGILMSIFGARKSLNSLLDVYARMRTANTHSHAPMRKMGFHNITLTDRVSILHLPFVEICDDRMALNSKILFPSTPNSKLDSKLKVGLLIFSKSGDRPHKQRFI